MNNTREGTLCNRAIMLITDGAPDNYEEIYREFNWPEKHVSTVQREFKSFVFIHVELINPCGHFCHAMSM